MPWLPGSPAEERNRFPPAVGHGVPERAELWGAELWLLWLGKDQAGWELLLGVLLWEPLSCPHVQGVTRQIWLAAGGEQLPAQRQSACDSSQGCSQPFVGLQCQQISAVLLLCL